jgi:hypothetical protein
MKKIIKRFDLAITQQNAVHSKTFELDKNITAVQGLLLTADKDDLLYHRGSQKIQVNNQEVFPEGYESKLLMSGINVSPNERFYNLGGLQPGNGKVAVDFKDNNSARVDFEAYRLSIYLICQIDETI